MIAVSARVLLASPQDTERFCELAVGLIEPTRQEPGCTLYAMARDIADDCVVWISEEWDSNAHLDAHLRTEHIAQFLGELANVNIVSMEDKKYEVSSVGHVEMPPATNA